MATISKGTGKKLHKIDKDQKSKIIAVPSVILFLLAIIYMIVAIWAVSVVLLSDFLIPDIAPVSFIKLFPPLKVIPTAFSLFSLALFYTSFKIKDGSRWSWKLGFLFPAAVALFTSLILEPTALLDPELLPEQLPITMLFTSFVFLIVILFVVLLLLSFKKFKHKSRSISKNAKVFLLIVFAVIVLPIVLVMASRISTIKNDDFRYKEMSSQVDFHVYKPYQLPDDWEYSQNFTIKQYRVDDPKIIEFALDEPLITKMDRSDFKTVYIEQVGVDNDFNLEEFVKTEYKRDKILQETDVYMAKGRQGYWVKPDDILPTTFRILVYVTEDNVLITLKSRYVGLDDLIKLAVLLE